MSLQSRCYWKPKAENNEAKKSVHIPEHCQAQNLKLLENVELPDHTTHRLYCTLTTVWQHNLLIMDKDTTAITESSKVFRETARHSIFGLHSKATQEFLPETLTGQKLYRCHCRGTQKNPKCRSTDIAFYVLWKISYTPQWGPSHHLPNCNPRLLQMLIGPHQIHLSCPLRQNECFLLHAISVCNRWGQQLI